jgi:hypothetical protein
VSRKRQIFFLVIGTPLIHFGGLLEMTWGCSGVKTSIKVTTAVVIFVTILTMRKMGRMVSESKTRVEITPVQKKSDSSARRPLGGERSCARPGRTAIHGALCVVLLLLEFVVLFHRVLPRLEQVLPGRGDHFP